MELTAYQNDLIHEILQLKNERNALILCHNYQRPELYEIADFIGDSLGLCIEASKTDHDMIVFCGVHFMAESAALINPKTPVYLPALDAGCAMADMITAEQLREKKKEYPKAVVVCYVNTSADVKAESDVCCTSSNAAEVVRKIHQKQILFVPDKNLAYFVQRLVPEKEIIPWNGFCPIHHRITVDILVRAKTMHPEAELVVHPECQPAVLDIADHIASTSQMIDYCKQSDAKEFIVITECGMVNRMMKEMPDKKFYTVCNMCYDMKKVTLEAVKNTLTNLQYRIDIPQDVAVKARAAFEAMFLLTGRRDKPVRFGNRTEILLTHTS